MKKHLFILVAFIFASSLALGAQSLKDNPSYQKSLELKAMAAQAYDDGDYDAAAEFAAQSKEYASLSDQYVDKMVAKFRADKVIAQAKDKMEWADGMDAKSLYPEQYGRASDEYSSSLAAYEAEDYPESADRARSTVEAVNAIAVADADAAIAQAKERMAWADSIHAKALYPDKYSVAADAYSGALGAYDSENYPESADRARSVVAAVDEIAVADADAAIAQAKSALGAAEAIEGPKNYPNEYAQGKAALTDAEAAYESQDYLSAAQRARDCVAALAGIKAKEVVTVVAPKVITWPAVYVVRLIPTRRDCLWRIAEYSFIYNNPLKWPVIYEANKKTFRDPSNPNLIFPGQKLQIPSIRGEVRDGTWDAKTEYQPFPKK